MDKQEVIFSVYYPTVPLFMLKCSSIEIIVCNELIHFDAGWGKQKINLFFIFFWYDGDIHVTRHLVDSSGWRRKTLFQSTKKFSKTRWPLHFFSHKIFRFFGEISTTTVTINTFIAKNIKLISNRKKDITLQMRINSSLLYANVMIHCKPKKNNTSLEH